MSHQASWAEALEALVASVARLAHRLKILRAAHGYAAGPPAQARGRLPPKFSVDRSSCRSRSSRMAAHWVRRQHVPPTRSDHPHPLAAPPWLASKPDQGVRGGSRIPCLYMSAATTHPWGDTYDGVLVWRNCFVYRARSHEIAPNRYI
jgi:hypothetical protein